MTATAKSTIVLLDDSPSMRELLQRGAQELDVELRLFDSTSDCKGFLQDNAVDLLFINIKMPGKDGLTILRELRELPLHKDTSVVMISSKDYAQDRSIAQELGALDFLTKPMPIRVITDVIRKYLKVDPAQDK